jgi:HAD superfamily hydrolase (TIGR01509 family)
MLVHCASDGTSAPAMAELRGVFWDVDGTLADTEMDGHRTAFNQAFEDLGLPLHWTPEHYADLLSVPGGMARVRFSARQQGVSLDDDLLLTLRGRKRERYMERCRSGHVRWRPGVLRLLRELDCAGVQQWIVTSSGRGSVSALLAGGGDGSWPFQGIVTADDVPEGKPSPAGYLHALQASGLSAEEGLALEDSAAGLRAARASGLACLLTPSPWDRDLLPLHGLAVAVLEHLGERERPAHQCWGPPCPQGLVTLEYLKFLLDPPA